MTFRLVEGEARVTATATKPRAFSTLGKMLLAFWELVLEQPGGGIFAGVKRPVYGLYAPRLLTQGVNRGQWGSRKSRDPPGHRRSPTFEGTVFWSRVSSKSSSPSLRGRPGDGSHAPDSLAPGELWVLQLFL
eukprot:bmy_18929T0